MAQEKNIGLNVTGGPSAGQMWDSLHRPHAGSFGGNMSQETAVYFTTTDTRPGKASFYATIDGMTREDGSGEHWNIEGRVFRTSPNGTVPYKAYYCSRDRSGVICVEG
ncbi:MAG: hypothetical protein WCQ00_02360 [bacterium]